jgi:hypothetical protein
MAFGRFFCVSLCRTTEGFYVTAVNEGCCPTTVLLKKYFNLVIVAFKPQYATGKNSRQPSDSLVRREI